MGSERIVHPSGRMQLVKSSDRAKRHGSNAGSRILQLQQSIGNHAVQKLIQAKVGCSCGGHSVDDETVQTKATADGAPHISSQTERNIQALEGGGTPMPDATRAFFEDRFGNDFSGVRIHTDNRASHSAQAIQARAFTTGRNIAFAPGEYSPGTTEGKRLLAHELTHVVQQSGGPR